MEIKIGQRWQTRMGVEARVIEQKPDVMFPWRVKGADGPSYSVSEWGHAAVGRDSPRDLVHLLAEDTPQDADEARGSLPGGINAPTAEPPSPAALFDLALRDEYHPYHTLATVLLQAFEQAAVGKGKERHAADDVPFENQSMLAISRQLGSTDGIIYQVHKKSLEAKRLPHGRNIAELLGVINYAAGAVIAYETWAKKEGV